MSERYTPTTGDIRKRYSTDHNLNGPFASKVEIKHEWYEGMAMEFDRWLAEHDKRIRREALTATDEELAVMEAAFDASIEDREDDGVGAMGIAMKALAASRERES